MEPVQLSFNSMVPAAARAPHFQAALEGLSLLGESFTSSCRALAGRCVPILIGGGILFLFLRVIRFVRVWAEKPKAPSVTPRRMERLQLGAVKVEKRETNALFTAGEPFELHFSSDGGHSIKKLVSLENAILLNQFPPGTPLKITFYWPRSNNFDVNQFDFIT